MPSSDKSKKLCIIILNWNNVLDTIECLNAVYPAVKRGLASIIVCDNASDDDSVEEILQWGKHWFPNEEQKNNRAIPDISETFWDFLLLRAHANNGYSSGNNLGIRYALLASRFSYLLILNNDTVVRHDALDELTEFADAHPSYGVIGSTILDYYDRDLVECAGGCTYNSFTTIFKNIYGGASISTALQCTKTPKLDYISGAASLFRTKVFRDFGLLEEDYFLYYEELDFARKIANSKYDLAWCKRSIIYHKGASTSGGRNDKSRATLVLCNYHENLSTLIFSKKHHAKYFFIPATLRFFGKTIKYVVSRKLFLFPALIASYKNYFSNEYGVDMTECKSGDKAIYSGRIR